MPSSEAILAGATSIANDWRAVAMAWHLVLVIAVATIVRGWRPSNRGAAYALSVPLLSVSAAAWLGGNPFNATVFAALFLLLLAICRRLSDDRIRLAAPVLAVPGVMLVVFGSAYPHFLETDSWITYACAAPLGVLPCPTLAAVIGATLVCGLHGSGPWSVTLAIAALAYGAGGVFALGVQLDYALVAGGLLLIGALGSVKPSIPGNRLRP
jgi:hypothetical protein